MRRIAYTEKAAIAMAEAQGCSLDAVHDRPMGRPAATNRTPAHGKGILVKCESGGFVALELIKRPTSE